jgi:hypothetical protein
MALDRWTAILINRVAEAAIVVAFIGAEAVVLEERRRKTSALK